MKKIIARKQNRNVDGRVRKALLLLPALLCLLLFTVTGTVAFIRTGTDPVVNEFPAAEVKGEIVENFHDSIYKEDVGFRNDSEIPVYVRARIVVTWQDGSGNVSGVQPVLGTDYVLTQGGESGWTRGSDGYWYYETALLAGETTGNLIDICYEKEGAAKPFGCRLVVDVLAQAVQAEPADAVTEAWGISVNTDGTLAAGL